VADVVLDEWLLIRGLDAEQPAAGLERECADLLAVVQTSHRWVMTDDIVDIYQRRLFQARYKGAIWTRLRGSFLDTLVAASRLWLRDVAHVDGRYDQDDAAWVSAAAAAPAGCLLVTGDQRLLVQLRQTTLQEQHGFLACNVIDALALLEPQQPALA
jgi:predicted nucleic acid-binding protein